MLVPIGLVFEVFVAGRYRFRAAQLGGNWSAISIGAGHSVAAGTGCDFTYAAILFRPSIIGVGWA
jgi:hypothetical protein